MPWTDPKLDWKTNPHNPIPDDFNRIEGNIDFLKTDIETKKGAIVDALNAVGISSSLTDTHAQLSAKITAAEKTGVVLTPGAADVPIPKGIYNTGGGKVIGDPDLIPENIRQGKSIFGISGNIEIPNKPIFLCGGYSPISWETRYNGEPSLSFSQDDEGLLFPYFSLVGTAIGICSTLPVDLTDYSNLKFCTNNSGGYYLYFGVCTTEQRDNAGTTIGTGFTAVKGTNQSGAFNATVDISSLTGSYYLKIHSTSRPHRVYSIFLH